MSADAIAEWLKKQRGVRRVETAPEDLLAKIDREEQGVVSSFGAPVICTGMKDCLSRDRGLIAFMDSTFWTPPATTMILRNSKNEVVGMDIPLSETEFYASRGDALFISDDFIMFTGVEMDDGSKLEMISSEYKGEDDSLPSEKPAAIWFPSPSSCRIIHEFFGEPMRELATALVAFDSDA